tara:strand:- start:36043 stop:36789 length:747 start_codon:yes stop_codon:yes gene_type:complete
MGILTRICAALVPMLALSACLLTPGKFTSSLDIRKDRSFTFAYKGEVIVSSDMSGMGKDMPDEAEPLDDPDAPAQEGTAYYQQIAASGTSDNAIADKEKEAKMQAIADALSKEKGYRSVRYLGDGKFDIDYQISGTLDHAFLFPFNVDAQAIIPFVAIEVRADGKVRVQAPGFANDSSQTPGGMGGMGGGNDAKNRDGIFTLTTDAEIVSQNQEDGATDTPRGKQIVWKVTPLTSIKPMAVLKLAPGT